MGRDDAALRLQVSDNGRYLVTDSGSSPYGSWCRGHQYHRSLPSQLACLDKFYNHRWYYHISA